MTVAFGALDVFFIENQRLEGMFATATGIFIKRHVIFLFVNGGDGGKSH
jgi:hypothetical protein